LVNVGPELKNGNKNEADFIWVDRGRLALRSEKKKFVKLANFEDVA
jgi:hypothetical protein